MENPTFDKVADIRQSDEWGEYLKYLGWKKHTIGEDKNLYSLKIGPLIVAKMQRPAPLSISDFQKLDELAVEKKLSFIKLEPSINQSQDLIIQAGFNQQATPLCPPATIYIDLKQSIEILKGKMSSGVRYSINKAIRKGDAVEFYNRPDDKIIELIYPILSDTFSKHRLVNISINDLKQKAKIWGDKAYVALVRDCKGSINGAHIYLGYKENLWYIHGGTSSGGRKTKSGYLLLWEAITYFKKLGYSFLDLEGKDDKRFPVFTKTWGGFSHFKERFGGSDIYFPPPRIKYYNKWLGILSKYNRFGM